VAAQIDRSAEGPARAEHELKSKLAAESKWAGVCQPDVVAPALTAGMEKDRRPPASAARQRKAPRLERPSARRRDVIRRWREEAITELGFPVTLLRSTVCLFEHRRCCDHGATNRSMCHPTSAGTWELLLPEPRDADGEDQPRRRRPGVTCPLADHGIIR
jgi:hypothetical protein